MIMNAYFMKGVSSGMRCINLASSHKYTIISSYRKHNRNTFLGFLIDSKKPSTTCSLLESDESVHIANVALDSSPSSNNGHRRKSVTFLDPFDEFDENDTCLKKANGNIPIPFENRGMLHKLIF